MKEEERSASLQTLHQDLPLLFCTCQKRKSNKECDPLLSRGLCPDLPSMLLNNLFTDCQSQAPSGDGRIFHLRSTIKWLKELCELFWRGREALVRDVQHCLRFLCTQAHLDATRFR